MRDRKRIDLEIGEDSLVVEAKRKASNKHEAEEHKIPYEFPSRMITLNVHSSLDAVGFLAKITNALAEEGNMGVNPVSGFYHDHLFVPETRADDAMKILQSLTKDVR